MEDIKVKIERAIQKIRPYLEADGGDIELVDVTNDVVRVRLMGACSSCSMSHMTMKAGVEESIRREVPEITKVIAIAQDEVIS